MESLTQTVRFPEKDKDIHHFYVASMAFVEFILEEYEYDSFHRLITGLRGTGTSVIPYEKICRRYVKEKPADVERKFVEFVEKKASASE